MERSIPIVDDCVARPAPYKTVFWLQGITTVWMLVECAVSLYAASTAHSVALLTFGAGQPCRTAFCDCSALLVRPIISDHQRSCRSLGGDFAFYPGRCNRDSGCCDACAWPSAGVKLRGHRNNDCCAGRDANPCLAQAKNCQCNRQ